MIHKKKIIFSISSNEMRYTGRNTFETAKIHQFADFDFIFIKLAKNMNFHPSRWGILGEKDRIWTKKHQKSKWMLHFYLSAIIQVMKIRYLKKVVMQKSENISLSEIMCIITYQIVKSIAITLRSNLSLFEKVVFRFMPLNEHLYIYNHH